VRISSRAFPFELTVAVGAAIAAVVFTVVAGSAAEASSPATGLLLVLVSGVGALLLAAVILEPWVGLLAWILAMPLLNASRLGLTIGGVLITHTTIVLAGLALGTFLASRSGRAQLATVPRLVVLVGVASAALALASGLHATDSGQGVSIALHGVVEPVILGTLVLVLADGSAQVIALALAMAASVTIATAYNLERLLRITFDLAIAQTDRTGFARFTYYNVGIYGDMLVMTIPLAVGLLLSWAARNGERPRRLLVLGMTVLLGLGLYLTFTKGPWLAGLTSVTGLLVVSAASWRRRAAIMVAAALIGMLIVPYPFYAVRAVDPALGERLLSLLHTVQGGNRADSWDPETAEGEVSITERLYATSAAVEMAVDHPLLGVGPGDFASAYTTRYRPAAATRSLQSAHDFFADVAAEFGLPLAALILGSFLAAGLAAIRLVRRAPPLSQTMALGFGAALTGFLIVGFTFGVDLYRPWRVMNSDVLFAALLLAGVGILARSERSRKVADQDSPKSHPARRDQPG
jgi:hypothetical protein